MPRSASIHIGVNRPGQGCHPLVHSEKHTWRMAELAHQAGYASLQVLRGAAATRDAVRGALARAAAALADGDTLLVTFSGHGCQVRDRNQDERSGCDEGWHLADDVLLDDDLVECWRGFRPGVKIVAVVESCYSAGVAREDEFDNIQFPRGPGSVYGGGIVYRGGRDDGVATPCIAAPPGDTDGIRARVLMLTASSEHQTAQDGLYSAFLLKAWNGGRFQGSYCELHRRVSEGVMSHNTSQRPEIMLLGAGDPAFTLEPAFRMEREAARVTRG